MRIPVKYRVCWGPLQTRKDTRQILKPLYTVPNGTVSRHRSSKPEYNLNFQFATFHNLKQVGEVVALTHTVTSASGILLQVAFKAFLTLHPQYPIFLHHHQAQVPHRRLKDPPILLHHLLRLYLLPYSHSLAEFVELLEEALVDSGIYSNVLCGVLRGAL